MKISGQDPMRLLESYLLGIQENREGASTKRSGRTQPAPSDNVEISASAKNYQQATKLIASAPEIRLDRVAEVQAKIESGTDPFQSAQVAERLIRSTLLDTVL
jgi:negative regulator of flagellin synthesis FlgM